MAEKRDLADDEIAALLKTVADHFNKEDRAVRDRQIRHWRRLKLYWANFSQVYWSETAQDYRLYNRDIDSTDTDQEYYDKPVNVFRAFLETIVAALSIDIPAINCVPDDANNPDDLLTSEAGDKIAELIYKHNNVILLWLHALYISCTEGLVACYTYSDEDKEYGTYKKKNFQDEEVQAYVCPSCGARVPDEVFEEEQLNKFNPDEEDDKLDNFLESLEDKGEPPTCFECSAQLDPELQKTKLIIPRFVGTTDEPKSRVCIEFYGGLYVKVANYAKTQKDTPYLIFSHETHYANILESYPKLRDKFPKGSGAAGSSDDIYGWVGRLSPQYRGEFPDENVTVKECWLRPASFNILDEEQYKKLKKKFPNGAKIVLVNDEPAEYCAENLDDHWTLSHDPMADYLNHDPLGELLTNIQDIVSDLISLTLQTIEHGIAQTWADPAVVNFNAQRQIEAMPGTLTPTKVIAGGKTIRDAFYSTNTASLSPEIFNFYNIIQELGQFVSGALPSLFGGNPGSNTSRTASEYAMSKGMALQRQQTPWRMMITLWKNVFGKAIPLYMKNMKEDERYVSKNEQGKFINTFIRIADLDGKIGSIELESDDKLPITDEQQAEIIMNLMQLNNAEITQALMDPENLPYIAKVIKIPNFRLPGQYDRLKQYEEISELINATPIPPSPESVQLYQKASQVDPQNAQPPQETPSVEIDPDVDDHRIEASICRSWLISPEGQLAKKENPEGYKNVLLHMKQHMVIVNQQLQQQQAMQAQTQIANTAVKNNNNGQTSGPPAQPEKVTGENNARSPIS